MKVFDGINVNFSKIIASLGKETIFYGTVNSIRKINNEFNIRVDLFSQKTKEIDLFLEHIPYVTYIFSLEINTPSLTMLRSKNEIFKFTKVEKIATYFDTYEATVSFVTNKIYDKCNDIQKKKMYVKVTKPSFDETQEFKEYFQKQILFINRYSQTKEQLLVTDFLNPYNKYIGIRYSQYHVGDSHSTYINIGNMTRGFFNIGYDCKNNDSLKYNGFSKHKPDWIIISNLNQDYYSGAIRYSNQNILTCNWIFPIIKEYNSNLIRLISCILISGGNVYMLKYKANSSVYSIISDDIKLEVYYTTDSSMDKYDLCLYIEHKDKFISLGNSDYNFISKSLVSQNFDVIVVPNKNANIKTKINLNYKSENNLVTSNYLGEARNRRGFKIHRTDFSGNFKCKI